ncbi:MAG: ABC transporter ATP-binding protein [Clostridia bacterium]|nr:ABC transporter ATP-binding protein [Clostridia bacterium]
MLMGPRGFGPPPGFGPDESLKKKPPKKLSEWPKYLRELIGGFFFRLFYVFGLVWETKPWILFLMMFMAIFDGVMPIVSAFISAELLNTLVRAVKGELGSHWPIVNILVLQFGYIIGTSLVRNVSNAITRMANEMVVNHIKLKISNKAKTLDLKNFDMPEFYAKLENATREAGHRPMQILSSTFGIVSTVISMVSFIVILVAVNAWAPVIIAVLAIPSAVVNFVFRKKNVKYMRFHSKERRQMAYYSNLVTDKESAKEVRIFGLADFFINKFQDTFLRYFKGLKKLIISENAWHISLTLVTSAVNCVLFLYIALKVYDGQLEVGDYSLYTGALNAVSSGISSFISTTATIYEGALFIENLITFMKEKVTIVPSVESPAVPRKGVSHTIEFKDVSFRYPGTERFVIKNMSFTLRPGETCVLVGLNGAGKTTLIKLLTRLYDPTEGSICLDGKDIKEYDVKALYDLFGIIFQDFGKYAFNVKENISFGDIGEDIDDGRIRYAAEQSDADTFISKLTDKYDTPLMRIFEENGIELSIGQWQKLSIARAFYGESDILILDEPTASLDPMAEQAIFDQFDSLSRDKTTIFVSHRLSSATIASKILVVEDGQLVEEGTHNELMALGGKYFTLFSTQANRYIENSADKSEGAPDNGAHLPDGMPPKGMPHPEMMPPHGMPGGRGPGGFPPPHGHPGKGDFSPRRPDNKI